MLFPFLVQDRRGVSVRLVPAAELAGEIDDDVDIVAFSAVQMATGEVADLDGIAAAAATHGAMTVVDATRHSGGFRETAGASTSSPRMPTSG